MFSKNKEYHELFLKKEDKKIRKVSIALEKQVTVRHPKTDSELSKPIKQ